MRGPCPLHGGDGPNFTVDPESGQWYCHSQCQQGGDVFSFLEAKDRLTFPQALECVAAFTGAQASFSGTSTSSKPFSGKVVATYDYTDEEGSLLYQVQRWEPGKDGKSKSFTQRRPDGRGGWINNLGDVRRVLNRLPEVTEAVTAGKPVYIGEGEAATEALRSLGVTATCNSGGAGNWRPEIGEPLCGAGLIVIPDNDDAGERHAQKVAVALHGTAKRVRIVRLPGLPHKEDAVEWIATGGTLPQLLELVRQTPDWTPDTEGPKWDAPVPFTAQNLPTFPVEALPTAVRPYVNEVAASTQVPEDMPGMMLLTVVAAASAHSCIAKVGQTHIEPLNLYACVSMEPGSRKSATVDALAEPLRLAEQRMASVEVSAVLTAKECRAVEEKRVAYLREQAAKAKNPEERASLMRELGETAATLTEVPALPRLLADDVTPEMLAGLLAEQRGTMAILSAEGGIFSILAGRYSEGKANLDLVLKAHAGEEYRVDRKSGPPVFIRRCCLTIGLAVQPDVLASLADSPSFRGRGLLGRFLYSLPENLVGTRLYTNRQADPHSRFRYAQAIQTILDLPSPATDDDPGARHTLRIEGETLAVWTAYYDDVETRQADGGDLAGIRDWASKLAGAVARIAGGMHLVEHAPQGRPWETPISPETMAAAWAIGEYLIPHALAAFGQMGADPQFTLARRLLRWIERTGQTEFSLRNCHQAHRSIGSPKELEPALELLCERGFLRRQAIAPRFGKGQPKSDVYEVNPLTQKSQNTQKSA